MEETHENLIERELRKALLSGLQAKSPAFNEEVIYSRLEKQGVPESLARQVAKDIMIEQQNGTLTRERPVYKFCFD